MEERSYLILDACVLLNLLATGAIEEILSVVAQNSRICALVKDESLYLRKEEDISENESIDLTALIENGIIQICDLETDDERQLFVNLAAQLDDGEAMSLAIALSREWHLATDDKKARKIFAQHAQNDQLLISTSDLIKEWAGNEKATDEATKSMLLKVERKARFRPSNSDQNFDWWNKILN